MDPYTRDAIVEADNCWGRGFEMGIHDVLHVIDDTCDAHADDADFQEGLSAAEEACEDMAIGHLSDEADLTKDAGPLPSTELELNGSLLDELTTLLGRITDDGRAAGRRAYAEAIRDRRDGLVADTNDEVTGVVDDPDSDDEDRTATREWARRKVAGYDHALATVRQRFAITFDTAASDPDAPRRHSDDTDEAVA